MSKLTEWFPPEIKPVHKGVYERAMCGRGTRYSFWDGVCWGGWSDKVRWAWGQRGIPSVVQDAPWRGLRGKP